MKGVHSDEESYYRSMSFLNSSWHALLTREQDSTDKPPKCALLVISPPVLLKTYWILPALLLLAGHPDSN